jgi:adenylate cyclase class IV
MSAHQELELKAVVPNPADLGRRLRASGATLIFRGLLEDRRYDRAGELVLRDEVLRTRRLLGEDGSVESVLGWKGPTRVSPEGYKLRDELEYRIEAGAAPGPLLHVLGYSIIHAIDRRIETFRLGQATLRVEHYPKMDVLLEVEGSPEGIETAILATGIPREGFMADSLTEFVGRYELRTGERAIVSGSLGSPVSFPP